MRYGNRDGSDNSFVVLVALRCRMFRVSVCVYAWTAPHTTECLCLSLMCLRASVWMCLCVYMRVRRMVLWSMGIVTTCLDSCIWRIVKGVACVCLFWTMRHQNTHTHAHARTHTYIRRNARAGHDSLLVCLHTTETFPTKTSCSQIDISAIFNCEACATFTWNRVPSEFFFHRSPQPTTFSVQERMRDE